MHQRQVPHHLNSPVLACYSQVVCVQSVGRKVDYIIVTELFSFTSVILSLSKERGGPDSAERPFRQGLLSTLTTSHAVRKWELDVGLGKLHAIGTTASQQP